MHDIYRGSGGVSEDIALRLFGCGKGEVTPEDSGALAGEEGRDCDAVAPAVTNTTDSGYENDLGGQIVHFAG